MHFLPQNDRCASKMAGLPGPQLPVLYPEPCFTDDVGGPHLVGGGEPTPRPGYLYLVQQGETLSFKIGRTGDLN